MSRQRDPGKREMIKAAALELFSQNGYSRTSIPDIVKKSGLSVGTVYNYFRNKEDILKVVILEGWEDFSDSLKESISLEKNFSRRLEKIITQFLSAIEQNIDLINILLSENILQNQFRHILDELVALMEEALKESPLAGSELLDKKRAKTAVFIYIMGTVNAIRYASNPNFDISRDDIKQFLMASYKLAIRE